MEDEQQLQPFHTNEVLNCTSTPQTGDVDIYTYVITELTNLNASVPLATPEHSALPQVFAPVDLHPVASSSQMPAIFIAPGDVVRVLAAAGVPPNEEMPAYWWRTEHKADLEALCRSVGITVDTCIERITKSGQTMPDLRQIADLEPLVR